MVVNRSPPLPTPPITLLPWKFRSARNHLFPYHITTESSTGWRRSFKNKKKKLGMIIAEKSKYKFRQCLRVFDKDLTARLNFMQVQVYEDNLSWQLQHVHQKQTSGNRSNTKRIPWTKWQHRPLSLEKRWAEFQLFMMFKFSLHAN